MSKVIETRFDEKVSLSQEIGNKNDHRMVFQHESGEYIAMTGAGVLDIGNPIDGDGCEAEYIGDGFIVK